MIAVRALLDLLLLPLRLLVATLRWAAGRLGPRPAFVEIRLEGSLRWRDLRRRRWALGRRRTGPTVHDLERLLAAVERDAAVRGVVIRMGELHAPRPRLVALRQALLRLRAAGKEVVLHWKHADNRHFALAPAASRILLTPGGPVHLVGWAATLTALRRTLDRAGVRPEFVRKGRYKTAPERFTHETITAEQRELVERILDHAFRQLAEDVASRRGGDLDFARAAIDGGPWTSRRALAAGLVDAMAYPDELPRALGVAEKQVVPAARFAARGFRVRWPRLRAPGRVAVVPIEGLIKPGKSFRWPGGSTMAGDESVCRALDEMRRDRRVGAVIVAVDSRGGAANASELIWRSILRCAREKPTAAWVESVAASGGYFAAAGAGRIVAAPGALVGSIGAFAGRFDLRPLLDRLGVRQEVILRGAHAGLLEAAHSLTDSDREVLRAELDAIYEEFVARVAEGRRRSVEEIAACAEGRVFLGAEAPPALVDQVGDFRDALAWVCAEAGIDPARAEVTAHERTGVRPDLGELLSLAAAAQVGMPLLLWADPRGAVEAGPRMTGDGAAE